jgi:hypothetical protein
MEQLIMKRTFFKNGVPGFWQVQTEPETKGFAQGDSK